MWNSIARILIKTRYSDVIKIKDWNWQCHRKHHKTQKEIYFFLLIWHDISLINLNVHMLHCCHAILFHIRGQTYGPILSVGCQIIKLRAVYLWKTPNIYTYMYILGNIQIQMTDHRHRELDHLLQKKIASPFLVNWCAI